MACLLLNGELPNPEELARFERGVMLHTMVHEQLRQFYNGFRRDAHPMAVICGVVGALSAFYHDSLDINNPEPSPHQRLPADRQNANDRCLGLQIFRWASRSCIRATISATRKTSCT